MGRGEEVINTGEAAAILRVERQTVARWVREGRLVPAYRTLGGHFRFRRADIVAMVETNKEES